VQHNYLLCKYPFVLKISEQHDPEFIFDADENSLRWYLLRLLDLIFHQIQFGFPYSYILYDFVLEMLKFIADILLISSTHQIITRFLRETEHFRHQILKIWFLVGEFLVIILSFMGLYYIISLLANQILWLGIASSGLIISVRNFKYSFQGAFFGFQWVLSFMVLIGSFGALFFSPENRALVILTLIVK
jgi:hypothetical protein